MIGNCFSPFELDIKNIRTEIDTLLLQAFLIVSAVVFATAFHDAGRVFAVTTTATAGTGWATATWSNGVPTSSDDAVINSGVRTEIISGRKTPVVERRAQNLGIQHLYQGREDKLVVLDELLTELGLSYSEVAYLGDDLPDLPVIRRVGLGMAVASADTFVREHAHGVTLARGGEGAAREFCELIMRAQGTLAAAQNAYL